MEKHVCVAGQCLVDERPAVAAEFQSGTSTVTNEPRVLVALSEDETAPATGTLPPTCVSDAECSAPDSICINGYCKRGCGVRLGLMCGGDEVCNTNTGRCVPVYGPCTMDLDCGPPLFVCEGVQCVPGCGQTGGVQCTGGEACNSLTGRCGGSSLRDAGAAIDMSLPRDSGGPADTGVLIDTGVVTDPCGIDPYEDNDALSRARQIAPGAYRSLTVCAAGGSFDDDYYAVTVARGQTINVQLNFSHSEGNIDATLRNTGGGVLMGSWSSGNSESLSHSANANMTVIVYVYLDGDRGTRPGNEYSMTITVQ